MQRSRNILALDAAGAACSCAVWSEGQIAARYFESMSRGQSERLVPMADEVMERAGLEYSQLDAIAVTLGPGGFTGVRIGLATARAFALALSRPVIGVTNFEAVAAAALQEECAGHSLVAVLDAKRADLYAQAFRMGDDFSANDQTQGFLDPLTAPTALLPDELDTYLPDGPLVLIGDAVEVAGASLKAAGRQFKFSRGKGLTDASLVAALAAGRPLPDPELPSPGPLYLRAPDVTLPGGRPFGARPGAVRSKQGS